MREMLGSTILLMTLTALHCGASDGVSSPVMSSQSTGRDEKQQVWRIEITTDGGITGKGLGSVSVDSSGHVVAADIARRCDGALTPAESSTLATAVAAAVPGSWRSSYETPGAPHGHPDQIHYSLTFTRDGKAYTTSWYGEPEAGLPADLAALRDASWQVRSRVVVTCK